MDRIIEDKRLIKPKHWKIIGAASLVLILIIFVSTRSALKTYKTNKDQIQIAEVFEDEFEDYIKLSGRVEPISTIYLDAIEGGRVEEIFITEGNMVKQGDVILSLSNNQLNLSILESEAQLAEKSNFLREVILSMEQQKLITKQELINLEFQLKKKKRDYERNQVLYKGGHIAKEEFLSSEDNYMLSKRLFDLNLERQIQDSAYRTIQIVQMEQNLENMKKNLQFVHQRLDNLNVKAPFDGQLGQLDAEIGQSINTGQRIGQINVLTSYKIACEVDEHYIDRVRTGLTANIDRDGKEYSLTVKKVYPEVRDGRFKINLIFNNDKPENMRTGQTFYVNLQLGDAQKAIQLEKGGFFSSTGGQWVYVLDASESYAIKRNVKIGRQNPKYFEVLEGLNPGEKVIISGYEFFGDNDRIMLK
ncbi:MAG: efflux RND transporter periplasmic adaptor subunit [Bacteroidales bacterium]|nr:efflux RND transporter periplasmic adaptor subunit [Bacteroidales bacterium]